MQTLLTGILQVHGYRINTKDERMCTEILGNFPHSDEFVGITFQALPCTY